MKIKEQKFLRITITSDPSKGKDLREERFDYLNNRFPKGNYKFKYTDCDTTIIETEIE